MKIRILGALVLVLPLVVGAAEIGGTANKVWCKGCPEKTKSERFIDEVGQEDAGVVVVLDPDYNPKRIILTSTTVSPVHAVCEKFTEYWPNASVIITTHAGGVRNYSCPKED